jgi:hypothetical protein
MRSGHHFLVAAHSNNGLVAHLSESCEIRVIGHFLLEIGRRFRGVCLGQWSPLKTQCDPSALFEAIKQGIQRVDVKRELAAGPGVNQLLNS